MPDECGTKRGTGRGRKAVRVRLLELELATARERLAELHLAGKIQANIAATFYGHADVVAKLGDAASGWQREQARRDELIAECHAHAALAIFEALGLSVQESPASVIRYWESQQKLDAAKAAS